MRVKHTCGAGSALGCCRIHTVGVYQRLAAQIKGCINIQHVSSTKVHKLNNEFVFQQVENTEAFQRGELYFGGKPRWPKWVAKLHSKSIKLAEPKLFSLFVFHPSLGVCEVAAFWENLDRGGGNGTREIIEDRKLADR